MTKKFKYAWFHPKRSVLLHRKLVNNNQNDPDNPFAAIVVAAKDTVASMVAATVTITVIMVVTTE